MGSVRAILETARQTAVLQWQNRLFKLSLLALLGAAVLVFLVGMSPPHGLGGRRLYAVVAWWIVGNVLLPWSTMYFGIQAVHGEIEERTFQYLFLRPTGRWTILLGKFLAVAGLSALVHGLGMLLIYLGAGLHPELWRDGGEPELALVFVAASALLAVAYAAVAVCFGALWKRPLVWAAGFIVFGQMFLANLPAKAGIRAATIADPVRRFVLDALDADPRLARSLWPSERNWSEDLVGEPVRDLCVLSLVALAVGFMAWCRSEYDARERE